MIPVPSLAGLARGPRLLYETLKRICTLALSRSDLEQVVPTTAPGDADKYLRGDNEWATVEAGQVSHSQSADLGILATAGLNTVQTALDGIDDILYAAAEPHGLEMTSYKTPVETTISYVSGTRTFSIAPKSPLTDFKVYIKGKRYTIGSTQSVVHAATEGLWFFYFDSTGTLVASQTPWTLRDVCPVATINWDAAGAANITFCEERHGLTMDSATHSYLHSTVGTRYLSGLTFGDYTLSSNGVIYGSLTDGAIMDEDIEIAITHAASPGTNQFEQVLRTANKALIPIFWRSGASGVWRKVAANASGYLADGPGGNNRHFWNELTGGSWQKTETGSGNLSAMWLFATNNISEPVIAIMGQRTDGTLNNARSNNLYESLALGSMPYQEFKLLYRLIFSATGATAWPNPVQLMDVLDLRSVSNLPSGTYIATAHSVLSGLDYASAGHTGFVQLQDTTPGTAQTGNINVSGAIVAGSFVGPMSGAASAVTIADDTTTNATMYPTWVTANTGDLPVKVSSSKLSFNPSSGLLTSTGFSGPLTGNATTASDGLTSASGTAPLSLNLAAKALTGSIAITPANPGGAVALQASTPGTAQTGHASLTGTGLFGEKVGIANTAPAALLHVGPTNAKDPTLSKLIVNDDSGGANIAFTEYQGNSGAQLILRRANGTAGSPSAMLTGGRIGSIASRGYGTSQFETTSDAMFAIYAAEDFSNAVHGTYATVETTPTGTSTRAESLRVIGGATPRVGIGTTGPGSTLSLNSQDTTVRPVLSLGLYSGGATNYGFDFDIEQASVGRMDIYRVSAGARSVAMSFWRDGTRVGIGTTTPNTQADSGVSSALDVRGDATHAGLLTVSSDRADAASPLIGQIDSQWPSGLTGGAEKRLAAINFQGQGSTANYRGGKLQFYTKQDNAGLASAIVIDNAQKVGIRTDPTSVLDVKDNASTCLRLSGSTSGYVGFRPPATAGATTYLLPGSDSTGSQYLKSDGAGNLSWGTPVAAGATINVDTFGAVADGNLNSNGNISSGTTALSLGSVVPSNGFSTSDIGHPISISGAGTSGGILTTTITAVGAGTEGEKASCTLNNAASTTAINGMVMWGTDNTSAINSALATTGSAQRGETIEFSHGNYAINGALTPAAHSLTIRGQGRGATQIFQLSASTSVFSMAYFLANLQFRDFSVWGMGPKTTGGYVFNFTSGQGFGGLIENVEAQNVYGFVSSTVGGQGLIHIHNCEVIGSTNDAIFWDSSVGIWILDSNFYGVTTQFATATMSQGSTTLTASGTSFSSKDIGKVIGVLTAGNAAGTTPLVTTITAVASTTSITLGASCAKTGGVSNVFVSYESPTPAQIHFRSVPGGCFVRNTNITSGDYNIKTDPTAGLAANWLIFQGVFLDSARVNSFAATTSGGGSVEHIEFDFCSFGSCGVGGYQGTVNPTPGVYLASGVSGVYINGGWSAHNAHQAILCDGANNLVIDTFTCDSNSVAAAGSYDHIYVTNCVNFTLRNSNLGSKYASVGAVVNTRYGLALTSTVTGKVVY